MGKNLKRSMRIPSPRLPSSKEIKLSLDEQKKFIYLSKIFSYIDKKNLLYFLKNNPIYLFEKIDIEKLLHRISDKAILAPNFSNMKNSSLEEYHVCLKNKHQFLESTQSEDVFLKYIHKISNDISNTRIHIRKREIIAIPNESGDYIIYPSHTEIKNGIKLILYVIRNTNFFGPLLSANIILSSLLQIHPLTDCNGRTSRIIFNIFIMIFINRNVFIPLLEISKCSNNSFLFSIKEAQIFNEWSSINKFINLSIQEVLIFNSDPNNLK
ncbi:Fic family protein [Gluconobacter thailandicus]|uniref:Fic family protein n=1 Tax=Gluconobacter thailandicus TaxID=257438 RepID=A0AAP9EQQ4_GLUTH|nr:Fic family protein [Gluconobacter thailandicus]QEH95783.1 Fic family protein [Gluconobacter thailandicus]